MVVVKYIFFNLHPDFWGNDPKLTSVFFKWVGATTNQVWVFFLMNMFVKFISTSCFFIVNGYLVRMIVCYALLWPDIKFFMSSFFLCVFLGR